MVLPICFDGRQRRQGWGVCLFEGLALAATISLAGAIAPAPAAAAVNVTVDGIVWSVDAITASLSDPGFESLITLDHMPWLGQKILAGQFAAAVGLALGQGNSYAGLSFGPVYLWKTDYHAGFDGPLDPEDLTLQARIAVATPFSPTTPAPSPLPLAGSLTAWQWSRRLRRRVAQRCDQASL
ncbi:MAG: hypothetical protein LW834_05160 [Cyanobium sp. 49614_E6]|nr:hypothetical protein [Cyanobium sp. 49614_E6]